MWVGGGPVWPVFFFDTSYFIYEPLLKMYTSDGKTGLGERSKGEGLQVYIAQTDFVVQRNQHNVVNQLYSNLKKKKNEIPKILKDQTH